MKSFRFAHSADLHLDSPFKGLASRMPDEIISVLRDSTFDAYKNIVSMCIDESVDALLIAGDIYDGADRSFKAQYRFMEGLKRLSDAGIRSFICHGNHDPLDGWQAQLDFPKGAYRFGKNAESFPLWDHLPEAVLVHGISYPTRIVQDNLIPRFQELKKAEFNIGLVHANVDSNPNHDPYAPCSLADLKATGYDYWALGHVHTKNILNSDHPKVVYPGNPQGRHSNETGERGIFIVDVDENGSISTKFRPVDLVRWEIIEISAREMENEQSFLDAMEAEFDQQVRLNDGRDLIVRAIVTGSSPIHQSLVRDKFAEEMRDELNEKYGYQTPFLWCERILVSTSPPFNRKERKNGTDFVADLLNLADDIVLNEEAVDLLLESVSDIYKKGKVGKHTKEFAPERNEIKELLREAENIYLADLLEEDAQ